MPRIAPTIPRLVPRFMGGSTLFNGTTSTIPTTLTANTAFTGGCTLSAWINPTSGGEGTGGRIIDKSELDSALNGIKLQILTASGTFLLRTAGTSVQSAANSVRYKKWQHVIACCASNGTISFYINGVISGTPAAGGTLASINTANALTIGNRSGATDFTFDGKIAEVKIYNSALTATQASELYSTGSVSGVSPVASYALDDLPSTYIDSIAGNNGTGTATTYSSDTPIGSRLPQSDDKASLLFDGSGDFINLGTPAVFQTYTSRSISVWIKPVRFGTVMSYFISGRGGVGGFSLDITTTGLFQYTKNGIANYASTIYAIRNVWQHVALTQNADNTASLYLNGALVYTFTNTTAVTASVQAAYIGTGIDGAGAATNTFIGNIMGFKHHNKVLTASEVQELYFSRDVLASTVDGGYTLNEGAGTIAYDSSGNGNNGTITGATWSSDTPSKARTLAVGRDSV